MKLKDQISDQKNLATDLGVRLALEEVAKLAGQLLVICQGYLFYDPRKIKQELVARVIRILEQELPVSSVAWEKIWQQEWEEALLIDQDWGIVSVRQIEKKKIGNSRFWARKLRKILA